MTIKEKQKKKVLKGLERNIDHQPAIPWRKLSDVYGLSIEPFLHREYGGQLSASTSIVYLRDLEVEALDSFKFKVSIRGSSELNYVFFVSTSDHEGNHVAQIFSNYGLGVYERTEKRNIAIRLAREAKLEKMRNCMPLPSINEDLWVLEAYPLWCQYSLLSYPDVAAERVIMGRMQRHEPSDLETNMLVHHAHPVLGQLLIQATEKHRNHSAAWNFCNQCSKLVKKRFGLSEWREAVNFTSEIIDILGIFKGSKPKEIASALSKLEPRCFTLWRDHDVEYYKLLDIFLSDWKNLLMDKLRQQQDFFDRLDFDGARERSEAIMTILNRIPTESKVPYGEYLAFHVVPSCYSEVLFCGSSHYIVAKPTADISTIKTLIGGFIDTYLADEVVDGKQLKCPFAKSPQNIFGCLDCSGLIDSEDLNHKCPHAKRWLN